MNAEMQTGFYPKNAPPVDHAKPYRVTAHRFVRGVCAKCFVVGDYRRYWQANLVSIIWYHVWGYGCNTWKAD